MKTDFGELRDNKMNSKTSIPQMALEALEPFKRLSDKFDHRPYNDGYADALRINGTGDDSKADVVRIHNFLTLGDCRKAKQAFIALEKCLSENGPKSEGAMGVSSTEPADPYYGAWREDADLILFKIPGHEEFRLSNTAAERLYQDFAKIVRNPSPSPSSSNAQGTMERGKQFAKAVYDFGYDTRRKTGRWGIPSQIELAALFDEFSALPSTIKEQPENKDSGEPGDSL